MFCKHSSHEIFEEERGFWGQCSVCGGVGAIKKTAGEARAALKVLKVERPHQQGGARVGAGRKRILPKDAKFRAFTLAPQHVRTIDQFIKKHNAAYEDTIKGRSAGLRAILEGIELDKLVKNLAG